MASLTSSSDVTAPAVRGAQTGDRKRHKPEPRRTTAAPPAGRPVPELSPASLNGYIAFLKCDDFAQCIWYVCDASKTRTTVEHMLHWLASSQLPGEERMYTFGELVSSFARKKKPRIPDTFPAEFHQHVGDFRDPGKWQVFENEAPPMPVTVIVL
jgi:hypothetical protein